MYGSMYEDKGQHLPGAKLKMGKTSNSFKHFPRQLFDLCTCKSIWQL